MDTCRSKTCCSTSCGDSVATPVTPARAIPGGCRTTLAIAQMDCPTEEALIRAKLGSLAGIGALEFNLIQRKLVLVHAPEALDPAIKAIRSLGMEATIQGDDAKVNPAPSERTVWLPLALSGVAATAAEIVHWFDGGNHTVEAVLAIFAIIVGGWPTYKKGWIALKNFNLNMNALMSIAVTGAFLIGQWPEGAMVMFLFALAELIEAKSLDRARNAIHGLMALTPETATVCAEDGRWSEVPASSVPLNALVRVRPGERIALDGVIVSGSSTVNQSSITGESLPVEKAKDDPVFAGTLNQAGSFEYCVTATATNSMLARIIHIVEDAQGAKAPTQRFIDRFARIYTPTVFAVALGMATIPPIFLHMPWLDAVYRALVLLVIACPCALVISTPVTIVSGLATAARHGILIKGGVYLEEGRKLTALALDKTGTLTHGKPSQTDFECLAGSDKTTVLTIATSLASRSDHPVSRAIALAAPDAGMPLQNIEGFTAIPGRGVRGNINGRAYHLGNHRLIEELQMCSPSLESKLDQLERQGKSVILLADDNHVLAIFAVADTVRQFSKEAIAQLHSLGIKTAIVTGDNVHTAQAISAQVGIDEALGNQLPEDKLVAIESLRARFGSVGMVGDGINDAPALAKADIGFAMGATGTDTAIETADVALMNDDLRKIPLFVRISRATVSVLRQNIALALGIKAAFIILAFSGEATMWMAVFADMGASLIVVFNGLRLLGYAPYPATGKLVA